jgi:uncharacterized membrane protein YbhN (UPF0104 family)
MSDIASPSPNQRRWTGWLRIVAGLALIGFLVVRFDWRPMGDAIRGLRWEHWFAALAIYLGSQVASAWRWAVLARPLGFALPQRRFLRLYFEGMFFSLCLPSSIGGDVFKAYRLATSAAGRVLAGCTVLADRATGLIGLVVIGLTALIGRTFGMSLLPTLAAGLALLVAALVAVSIALRIMNWLAARLSSDSRLGRFAAQLQPYHSRPEVFRRAIGWGLLVQGLNIAVVIEIGNAMGLSIPLGAYCVAVPAVALLTILPVSISGVGVREGGLAWMLSSYGLAPALGVTLGLLWFLVTVVSGFVGGIAYLLDADRQETLGTNQAQPTIAGAIEIADATEMNRRQAA